MNRSETVVKLPFRVVIPARYGSTRLPGKPLRMLAGKPLIEHVYHKAQASGAQEVIIATDDRRICQMAEGFGATVCMTAVEHPSGTDRLAEVVRVRGWTDDAIIVNLQGDEPLMPPTLIDQVAADLHHHQDAGMATLCVRIYQVHEIFNPHLVKVVRDAQGYALFFSRAPIPYHRDQFCGVNKRLSEVPEGSDYFRHIGLYAYRACVLRRFPRLSPCMLERTESLEQLRALWHGIRIHVQEALEIPQAGVDTEQDLARVMAFLANA